jgi:tRNA threonylcarbamoyladenosine biosynthesis protein TsaE
VQSPTFGLVHTYRDALGAPVYHLDLYRLRNEQEGWGLGLDELFETGSLCLVEWAEKIPTFLPENPMRILIDYHEDTHLRTVELTV